MKSNKKRTTMYIDEKLYKALKFYALKLNKPICVVVEDLIKKEIGE